MSSGHHGVAVSDPQVGAFTEYCDRTREPDDNKSEWASSMHSPVKSQYNEKAACISTSRLFWNVATIYSPGPLPAKYHRVLGTGGKRVSSGHHGAAVSDPQVGAFTEYCDRAREPDDNKSEWASSMP